MFDLAFALELEHGLEALGDGAGLGWVVAGEDAEVYDVHAVELEVAEVVFQGGAEFGGGLGWVPACVRGALGA